MSTHSRGWTAEFGWSCASDGFNVNGGAVGQHLRDALHYFGGIVPGAHDGIAAELAGVQQHQVKGFGTRLLAQLRKQADVAADNRLQAGAYRSDDGARAH